MNAALRLPARAKLNLWLRVVGRRDDGYHLLDTIFHTLQLHDDLCVARVARGLELEVTAGRPELLAPTGPDNLVLRALAALQREAGDDGGFHARLHKRIPHGGGLGGGSSDAAAALRLGNELLGRPLDDGALHRLAATLGADVPFFLRGGTQRGRGVGDELTPFDVAPRHFVLVVPPFGCDTAAVYKIHAGLWQGAHGTATVHSITVPENWGAALGIGYANDLQRAAEQLRPELPRLRTAIDAAGHGAAQLTGSGSTMFLAFERAEAAAACARDLQHRLPMFDGRPVGYVVTASGPPAGSDEPEAEG